MKSESDLLATEWLLMERSDPKREQRKTDGVGFALHAYSENRYVCMFRRKTIRRSGKDKANVNEFTSNSEQQKHDDFHVQQLSHVCLSEGQATRSKGHSPPLPM